MGGGGGNCVKIKHNSTYQTVYAHMKSFAERNKEGRKLERSNNWLCRFNWFINGPHLHYEVIVNGKSKFTKT